MFVITSCLLLASSSFIIGNETVVIKPYLPDGTVIEDGSNDTVIEGRRLGDDVVDIDARFGAQGNFFCAPTKKFPDNPFLCGIPDNKIAASVLFSNHVSNKQPRLTKAAITIPPEARVFSIDVSVRAWELPTDLYDEYVGPLGIFLPIEGSDGEFIALQDPKAVRFDTAGVTANYCGFCQTTTFTVTFKENPLINALPRSAGEPVKVDVFAKRDASRNFEDKPGFPAPFPYLYVDEIDLTINYRIPGEEDFDDDSDEIMRCAEGELYFPKSADELASAGKGKGGGSKGSCYKRIASPAANERLSYETGKSTCAAWGGAPVSLNSEQELSFVVGAFGAFISQPFDSRRRLWLGLKPNADRTQFTWEDGTDFQEAFTKFGPTPFPNPADGEAPQDCVAARWGTFFAGSNAPPFSNGDAILQSLSCDGIDGNEPIDMVCEKPAE